MNYSCRLGCALFPCLLLTSIFCQASSAANNCLGTTTPPKHLRPYLSLIDDPKLLEQSLGLPTKGKLCQGQVYQVKEMMTFTIYRAWNSTNPNSRLGNWWAFQQPIGKVAEYRSAYEICYQWSPLDKLTHCDIKPGSKIVIGNGQSAICSAYLTYPKSSQQQIYIADAENVLSNCVNYNAQFNWSLESTQKK